METPSTTTVGSEVLDQKSGGNNIPPTSECADQKLNSDAGKYRSMCFTLWTDVALDILKGTEPTYLVYAPEVCPTTKRDHFQCYAYYRSQRSIHAMRKKLTGNDCRPALGTAEENRKYIIGPYSKNGKDKPFNPNAVEVGTIPNQGERTDLRAFDADIKAGKRGRDLSEDHLELRAKYPKLEHTLIYEDDEAKAIQMFKHGIRPYVYVRWGKPGSGKSRYVYDKHKAEDIYELNLGDGSAKSVWWDGYRGHEVIVINDFDGEIGFKYLLRLLDVYPFRMQVKGGHVWRLCKYIYITANSPPSMWYPAHQLEPLMRRITSIDEIN